MKTLKRHNEFMTMRKKKIDILFFFYLIFPQARTRFLSSRAIRNYQNSRINHVTITLTLSEILRN